MVICICGKEFQTEAGLKQHLRRRYCRGPNNNNVCNFCPAENSFDTYAGLRQHLRLAHPTEYNKDLEDQANNPVRDKSRWTEEDLISMAKEEIKFTGRFINKHLASIFKNRGIEAIKTRRRLPDYVALINELRTGPVNTDIEEEIFDVPAEMVSQDDIARSFSDAVIEERLVNTVGGLTSGVARLVDLDGAGPSSSISTPIDLTAPGPSGLSRVISASIAPRVTDRPSQNAPILNPNATSFIPLVINHLNSSDDIIFIYLQELILNGNWDDRDRDLIEALSVKSINTELKELLLDNWLKALYKRFIKQKPKNEPNPKPVNQQINTSTIKRKNMRALLYKKTQELYRKNRAELAECILDDRSPLSTIEQPPMDALTRKFSGILSADSMADDHPILDRKDETPNLYAPVTQAEIAWALSSTKSNSAGPDGLRVKHLKHVDVSKLGLLFNIMLLWGHIPTILKESKTILIPKAGDTTNVDNWRPLTISSILLRLINKILGKRFASLPIHQLQRGFRSIDGVLLNNLTLDLLIRERRQSKKPYSIVSIDLRKAFDSVSHTSIKRAFNRFAIDNRLQSFVLHGYSDTYTTLQLGTYKSNRIHIRRGVKQGDPLSPYLFNMVIDELIEKLQNKNVGLPLNDQKISCMCYADDLILLGSTIKETQDALKIATDFFNARGLIINHKKSIATSVGIVPGKKILYTITKNIFCAQGSCIPQSSVDNFWRYLGSYISSSGIAKPNISLIKTQLARVECAPLKPPQKLAIIKTYLIPRLLHLLQTPRITIKLLKDVDTFVRISVRKILHLNRTCADAFIHAPVRFGGLGVLSMRSHIPIILNGRLHNIVNSHDRYGSDLSRMSEFIRLENKFRSWSHNVDSTTMAARNWCDALEASFSGNGLLQGSSNFHSGGWIDNPPPFWSGSDYVRSIQLRGNLLPTMGIPSNPQEARKCRGGCDRNESLSHVLQRCPVTHWNRVRRHDRIVNLTAKMITKRGWKVEIEPRIRCASGLLKIPDLICTKNDEVVVCDVAIPWEGPQSLGVIHNHKIATYGNAETIAAIRNKYATDRVLIRPLIIGARGIWCSQNNGLINVVGIRQPDIRVLINNTINGSVIVHREFMKSVFK